MSKKIDNIALISSAGAGKTRSLTQRFLFLYLHKTNYPLNSLYGITFTNEAAFEMKSRILKYLDLLIVGKSDDESEQNIIEYFTKFFPDIKERARKKKRYLLNNLSELNISTFHSLFASFLSSIPFAAGVLPGYKIVDEADEEIIYESVLDRFFEVISRDKNIFNIINELLEQKEISIRTSIKDIYWYVVPWLEFLENLVGKEKDIKSRGVMLEQRFVKSLEGLKNFVRDNESAGYTKSSSKMNNSLLTLLNKIDDYLETQNFDKLSESEYTKSILRRDIDTKGYIQKFINNLGERSTKFLKIIDDLKKYTEEYLNLLSDQQILIHLKPILEIHKLLQREKQNKNAISFNDIETYTLHALKHNPEPDYIYFKIGAEIRHLMIDEFQDTSHRQLEIIEPLISEITSLAPSEKSIFYVGDPKQAIFRWRGGSSELFYTLMEKYPGKIKSEELIINYRSKEEIVKFVNKLLDKNDKAKADNTGGWIRVENLGEFTDRDSGELIVTKRIRSIIEELHKNHGYRYSEIAILVRTNRFGVAVAEDLTKKHIPCVSGSRADILNNDDVQFILNLLKFLDNPENDFALMHVLLSPFFKIKEETLRHFRYTRKTLFLNLCDGHPGWSVTKKLERLLSIVHFCNAYELIYQIFKELEIKISYSLATLLDVALEYTKEGFGHLSSFIDWIEKVGGSIEIQEIHPEGVRILTVHKAKGLEFEVVIIPETNWKVP
ncbi:MAG: UvrD-helicase domain-containing protein, partial [Candidatus Hodarchaeota archaeon]